MLRTSTIDQRIKRLKSQLANLLTFSNLMMGGFAIIFILQGELKVSLLLIFLAALFDRFDGKIARKLKIESELGKQLDSMSDIISFGVAPALLLYQAIIHMYAVPGIFFTVFYIGCGAFRLARYNISENNGYYTGLPITAAGSILAFSYLFVNVLPSQIFLFLLILLSFFMISSVSVKKM